MSVWTVSLVSLMANDSVANHLW